METSGDVGHELRRKAGGGVSETDQRGRSTCEKRLYRGDTRPRRYCGGFGLATLARRGEPRRPQPRGNQQGWGQRKDRSAIGVARPTRHAKFYRSSLANETSGNAAALSHRFLAETVAGFGICGVRDTLFGYRVVLPMIAIERGKQSH